MINEISANSTNAMNNPFIDNKPNKNLPGKDVSYDSVLKSAVSKQQPKLEVKSEPRQEEKVEAKPIKMDKPKIGNKKPFFPSEPGVPYHPSEDEVRSKEDHDESFVQRVANRRNSLSEDDREGVMKDAFDSSVVSYPIRQIASESLDDSEKQALMSQGLWDMQGMYMAKPSDKFTSILETNEKAVPMQKPVAQFMASMENELGVSPDRLVQAYSQLAQGQLQKSPQETMGEVIKKLDLSPVDQKKATELYSKMLSQMQQIDTPKMDQEVEAKSLLAAALINAKAAKSAKTDDVIKPVEIQSSPKMKMENAQGFNQNSAAATAYGMQSAKNSEHGMMGENQSQGQSGFSQEHLKEAMGKNNAEVKSMSTPELANPQLAAPKAFDTQVQSAMGGMATGEAMNAGESAKMNRHEAIQGIINNAHALSQKGGGEMTMTLKPEHLGEIQLKVSMNGNQVNVQMVADKPEAKKLLEQNIQELKHGLSTHNLSMEKLDVSLSDKSGFQNQQNGKPDFSQARDFAQQSFAQNHGGSGNKELDDLRAGRTHTRSMLKASSANSAMKTPRQGSSSGKLNVVA